MLIMDLCIVLEGYKPDFSRLEASKCAGIRTILVLCSFEHAFLDPEGRVEFKYLKRSRNQYDCSQRVCGLIDSI
jgi:hypothetical protein